MIFEQVQIRILESVKNILIPLQDSFLFSSVGENIDGGETKNLHLSVLHERHVNCNIGKVYEPSPQGKEWWPWQHGNSHKCWVPPDVQSRENLCHLFSEQCPVALHEVLTVFGINAIANATIKNGLDGSDIALDVHAPNILAKGPPTIVHHFVCFCNNTQSNILHYFTFNNFSTVKGAALYSFHWHTSHLLKF